MSKLLLSIIYISLLLIPRSYAQNLKTFSGVYEDGEAEPGKATFTYYEDPKTREHVKHGLFKYHLILKSDAGNCIETITGNYKQNKKDGVWTYIINELDYHRTNGYFTGSITLTSNYLNGLPNGLWSYSRTYKGRDRLRTLSGFVWSAYKIFPSESVTATFKNGTIIGHATFHNSPPYSEYNNISGQFDSKGFMNNQWTFTSPDKIKTVLLKDGIVTQFIVRSKSSGAILSKDIDDNDMLKLKTDFLAGKISNEQLKDLKIKIDTLVAVQSEQYDFTMSFNRDEFKYRYIEGDHSYYYPKDDNGEPVNKDGWVDKRHSGAYILFTKTKTYMLSELSEYNQIVNFQPGDVSGYETLVENYKNFLNSYQENLSKDDLSKVENDLAIAKEKCKKASIALDLESADKWLGVNEYKEAIDRYNKFLIKWKSFLTKDELSSVNFKLKFAQEKFQITNSKETEEQETANNFEKFSINKNLIDKQNIEISNAYGYVENAYRAGDARIKKNIYWAYINIYNNIGKRIQVSSDVKESVKLTDQVIKLQNKILELSKVADTKDLEKVIKKAKSIEEQTALFE